MNKRRICLTCRVVFCPEIEEQEKCYRCLTADKERKIKNEYQLMRKQEFGANIKSKYCSFCGQEFIVTAGSNNKTCSSECRGLSQSRNNSYSRKMDVKDPIAESNKEWIAGKEKKKGRCLPLDVLNAIEEKKRVWNDAGWDHYLSGRKWDRI